jgi:hypothetical protein
MLSESVGMARIPDTSSGDSSGGGISALVPTATHHRIHRGHQATRTLAAKRERLDETGGIREDDGQPLVPGSAGMPEAARPVSRQHGRFSRWFWRTVLRADDWPEPDRWLDWIEKRQSIIEKRQKDDDGS